MTATPSGIRPEPPPWDLAARLFRALYSQFELRSFGGLYVAVPKGKPWYAGHSLTEIACQISALPPTWPNGDLDDQPCSLRDGTR